MASNDSHALGLTTAERALLDLAADDRRDTVSFAPQEELLLQLYDKIQELELERAILEQGQSRLALLMLLVLLRRDLLFITHKKISRSLAPTMWKTNLQSQSANCSRLVLRLQCDVKRLNLSS